jgi:hypothetical protein
MQQPGPDKAARPGAWARATHSWALPPLSARGIGMLAAAAAPAAAEAAYTVSCMPSCSCCGGRTHGRCREGGPRRVGLGYGSCPKAFPACPRPASASARALRGARGHCRAQGLRCSPVPCPASARSAGLHTSIAVPSSGCGGSRTQHVLAAGCSHGACPRAFVKMFVPALLVRSARLPACSST